MAQFEITRHSNGEFQFVLRGSSGGTVMLRSEGGYRTKDNCKKGIESVRQNSVNPAKFEVRRAPSGRSYFVLKSINGRTIGISDHFMDESSLQTAMRLVRKNAMNAKLVDITKMKNKL